MKVLRVSFKPLLSEWIDEQPQGCTACPSFSSIVRGNAVNYSNTVFQCIHDMLLGWVRAV